ncbi:hypothetical protein Tco_1257898 [Tanacetum coccineum]
MKIQARVQVSRPGELRRHLQLWKCFGRLYFVVIILDRNIFSSSSMASTHPGCFFASEAFLGSSSERKSTKRHSRAEAALRAGVTIDGMGKGKVGIGVVFCTEVSFILGEDKCSKI